MERSYLQDRITAVKAMIAAYEAAITAIATDGLESYTLDTGQTIQKVTKANLSSIQASYNSLLNLLTTLEARLSGNQNHVRPAW